MGNLGVKELEEGKDLEALPWDLCADVTLEWVRPGRGQGIPEEWARCRDHSSHSRVMDAALK